MAADDPFGDDIGLAQPYAPPVAPMKRSFMDFRREHGSLRIGLRGEDGSLDAWDALYATIGWDRLSAAYKALRKSLGQAVWYSAMVSYLEDEAARAVNAVLAPPRDMRPVLLDFLRTPKPTPAQAAAIAYLRKLAKERGLYSLNLTKAINGVREVLPEVSDSTIAASLGRDEQLMKRMVQKGLIK